MAGTRGFTAKPIPVGADARTYRPGIKKDRAHIEAARRANWEALPEEEKQRRRDLWAADLADNQQWRKDVDQFGPIEANRLLAERAAKRRADEEARDLEARNAVEGGAA